MSYATIRVAYDERDVATVTLARPEKHNALNATMIAELRAAVREITSRSTPVRAVVLAADGKSFCAGGDLGWMREQADADRAGKIKQASELACMLRDLDTLPMPLIGRVQGQAYGGGIGMMSVCDVVIATNGARFSLTEVKLGLIPATIGPYVVRRLGEANARQVFFSGRSFDAAEALRIGLVSSVVEADEIDAAIARELKPILASAPGAVAAAKALCLMLARSPGGDHLEATVEALADRWEDKEASEGIRCFFAGETPPWAKS